MRTPLETVHVIRELAQDWKDIAAVKGTTDPRADALLVLTRHCAEDSGDALVALIDARIEAAQRRDERWSRGKRAQNGESVLE